MGRARRCGATRTRRCLKRSGGFSGRYAEAARKLANRAEPQRHRELLEIADICERVPEEPAASFREAPQAVNFLTFCLSIRPLKQTFTQYQLGRPARLASWKNAAQKTGILEWASRPKGCRFSYLFSAFRGCRPCRLIRPARRRRALPEGYSTCSVRSMTSACMVGESRTK